MNEMSMSEGGMEEKRVNFWGVHWKLGGKSCEQDGVALRAESRVELVVQIWQIPI